jgi:hypothetical protein
MGSSTVSRSYRCIRLKGLTKVRAAALGRGAKPVSPDYHANNLYFYDLGFLSGVFRPSSKLWRNSSACRCCHTRDKIIFWQGTPPLRGAMRQRDANPQYENSFLQHVSQMTIRILTVKYYTIFRWKLGVWDARRIKNCKKSRVKCYCSLRLSALLQQYEISLALWPIINA